MRNRRVTRITLASRVVFVALAVAFLAAACNPFGPAQVFQTTSVGIAVEGGAGGLAARLSVGGTGATAARSLAADGPSFAIVNSPDPANITRMAVTVTGLDRFGFGPGQLATLDLSFNGSSWEGTIDDLPIGTPLTFEVIAYDSAADQLYDGVTVITLGGPGETVDVVLEPSNRGQTILFPVINQIALPAEIVRNTDAAVDIDLTGSSDETLSVSFAPGEGTFSPDPTSILLSTSGAATLSATYSAPDAVGTYPQAVTVENEQGNSVTTGFDTTVVFETGSAVISIQIAPSISQLSASRTGNQVSFGAVVADDGPGGVVTQWSFTQTGGTPGAAFVDPSVIPGVLDGYDETVTGTVTLTATDDDGMGLSTSVSFELVAGAFPDSVVQTSGGGSGAPVITSVSVDTTDLTDGGTFTLTVIASSTTRVDWFTEIFEGPNGNIQGGGSNHFFVETSPGTWELTKEYSILPTAPSGLYYFTYMTVQNEALLESDPWPGPYPEITVTNSAAATTPVLSSVTATGSTAGGGFDINDGGEITLTVLADSNVPVNWFNGSFDGPNGNIWGGGGGAFFTQDANGFWTYSRVETISPWAPSGTYTFSNLSVQNEGMLTSDPWPVPVEVQVNNTQVAQIPVITDLYTDVSTVTGSGTINLTVVVESNAPVNWFQGRFEGPTGNIWGGGGTAFFVETSLGVWEYTYTDTLLPDNPTGSYIYSDIRVRNEGDLESAPWPSDVVVTKN